MKYILIALTLCANAAYAEGFQPLRDRSAFLATVADKHLRNRLYGVRLMVNPDGTITGSAVGRQITGSWDWQDGYFCRAMRWGTREIPANCQLVETNARAQIRFTVDYGTGDSAVFRIENSD